MDKKRLNRKCEYCQKIFPVWRESDGYAEDTGFVVWTTDPFQEEINEDYTKLWLCHPCWQDAAWEI